MAAAVDMMRDTEAVGALTHLYPIMGRDGADSPEIRRFRHLTD